MCLVLALAVGCTTKTTSHTLAADDGGTAGAAGNGGAGGSPTSAWPDSPTVYCSDGTAELATCPARGERGYGQDGNYRIGVPTYEKNVDYVHDTVTGLDWERGSTPNTLSWDAAMQRCASLQLAGRTWRLPSRLELASLIDFGRELPFADVAAVEHWSSSTALDPNTAWAATFLDYNLSIADKAMEFRALCVTGTPLESSFTTNTDTLSDALTGLEWQRVPNDQGLFWLDALDYCEGLDLAGKDDWRLPSVKELVTPFRDDETRVPGLDGADADIFWTSSPNWPPTSVYAVRFTDGTTLGDYVDSPREVRCVRGPD